VQAAGAVLGGVVGGYAGYSLARSQGWGKGGTVAATIGAAAVGAGLGLVAGHLAAGGALKVAVHKAHHTFPIVGKAVHLQVNWWTPGVKGSGGVFRLPLWPGRR